MEQSRWSFLRDVHPAISLGAAVVGVVVWAYNTFSQITYVKEQNESLKVMIEQRHQEAINHSDMNRERMLATMQDIKESVLMIQNYIMKKRTDKDR